MTWTVAVTVTPTITATTIRAKNTEPNIVTAVTLLASELEKSPKVTEPAGKEPATMNIKADTTNAQPAI